MLADGPVFTAVFREQVMVAVPFQFGFLSADALMLIQVFDFYPQRLLPLALVLIPALPELVRKGAVAGARYLIQSQRAFLLERHHVLQCLGNDACRLKPTLFALGG